MVDRVANAARAGADLAVANRLAAFQAALDRRAAYVAQGGYRPRMSEAIDVDQEFFRTALPSASARRLIEIRNRIFGMGGPTMSDVESP
jgi:hypothetical protein